MEEQLISPSTLTMLKDIGFIGMDSLKTLSIVQKWLREKQKIIVSAGVNVNIEWENNEECEGKYAIDIAYYDYEIIICDKVMRPENDFHDYETHYPSYEIALEEGIKKVCQHLICKKIVL